MEDSPLAQGDTRGTPNPLLLRRHDLQSTFQATNIIRRHCTGTLETARYTHNRRLFCRSQRRGADSRREGGKALDATAREEIMYRGY